MSPSEGGSPRQPTPASAQDLQRIVDQFAAACRDAPSAPPSLDEFLRRVPQDQRDALRSRLLAIQSQMPRSASDTQKSLSDTKVDSAAEEPLATIDPSSESVSHPPAKDADDGVAATIDPSSAPSADIPRTIDPGSSSNVAATIDPEPGPTVDPDRAKHTLGFQFSWDQGEQGESNTGPSRAKVSGYDILGELGRGGMGVVYRARQRGLNRQVALKMILAGGHAGPDQLERFRAEAQAVALLQHPNIVQIYDVGDQNGLPFFSLEYVDGSSLEDEIDDKPQLPERAAEITETLSRAMHYAHQQGIVHRDLKPANVLLTSDGIPKITDFGLVKRVEGDSAQTRTGTVMGTPSFMAPEQARGEKDVGPLADVYALGSILYVLLTGRPPFLAATPMDTLMQLLREEPVAPSRLQAKIPADLEVICLKCLQKEPHRRYESAEALAADLRRYQKGEPIVARPVGRSERLWRWCRRNPYVAIPSGLAVALAIAVMIGGPVAAGVIYRQKERAVEAEGIAVEARKVAEQNEDKAVAAQKEADENAALATTQRQLALDTLYTVVTEVEEKLRDRSELTDLRMKVLELAMDGLDNVSKSAETADFADRQLGAAHQRMGEILLLAGKTETALEQFRKGLTIFDRLLSKDPANDLARWNAGLANDGLADAYRKLGTKLDLAQQHYEAGLQHRQYLNQHATHPKLAGVMLKAAVVNSYGRLGRLALDDLCDPASAVEYYRKAVEVSDSIDDGDIDESLPEASKKFLQRAIAQSRAGSWWVLATAMYRMGDDEGALRYSQQALAIRQELLDQDPLSVKNRQDVALSHRTLGDLALRQGNAQAALDAYQQDHQLRMELYNEDPENSEMQEDLSKSHYLIGNALTALAQTEEARQHYQESLQLRTRVLEQDPENAGKRLDYLRALARCGDHQEASRQLQELRDTLPANPGNLFAIARGYALCATALPGESETADAALRETYLQSALDVLREAHEAGFKDPLMLTSEPDLESLRPLLAQNS